MVCTLVSHRNDIRMFKTQVEPRTTGDWFQCKVLNILMSFLWWIRLQTMENCCRFVFTITLTVLTSISIEVSWNNKLCHHHVTSMVCTLIKNACYYLSNNYLSHYIQRICVFHCCFLNL